MTNGPLTGKSSFFFCFLEGIFVGNVEPIVKMVSFGRKELPSQNNVPMTSERSYDIYFMQSIEPDKRLLVW